MNSRLEVLVPQSDIAASSEAFQIDSVETGQPTVGDPPCVIVPGSLCDRNSLSNALNALLDTSRQ